MWFLHQKVILTKDNLAKRNWNGCPRCVFCDSNESINHLFFKCPLARLVWRVVFSTFNIVPPAIVTNMFRNWLNGVDKITKARIRVGTCALVWALWNYRNDTVFNKGRNANFLQVIHMATHWIHEWSCLFLKAQRAHMNSGYNRLEMVARDIYILATWRSTRRLHDA
jgi:hypothetical protein